ncbi:hypothetical protein ABMY47_12090 [Pseudoalteromonas sp. BZP1]|uniref:helix-turn-helix domain-containing protein n=1 Tax=unclassified Pseudoalteromonas TaxID=194690 RepID=UPI0032C41438
MTRKLKNNFSSSLNTVSDHCGKKKQVFFALEVLAATKSDTQTLILGHIAYHHAKHGKFNSSVSAIAKHLSYSVNAVKNGLKKLLEPLEDEKEPLLIESANPSSYSRTLHLNVKHPLGYRLLQSYTQMLNKQQTSNTLRLYPVQLHLFDSKSRYDSRHKHKMLMLQALITSKIKAGKIATRNKRDTYQQSISQLASKLGWAYMTVKSLIETMLEVGLLSVVKEKVRNVVRLIFSRIQPAKVKLSNIRQPQFPISAPIERYRDSVN